MKHILPTLLIILAIGACTPQGPISEELKTKWVMGKAGSDSMYPAIVPGCAHMDLMANGLIDDPFYADNESKLQWIGEEKWEYSTVFQVDKQILEKDHIDLVFDGLDTYAEVYLNDSSIITANNMFRRWQAEVKGLLREGNNSLKVLFSPPGEINEKHAASLPYQLPDNRVFTRKSPYQFGWDWGPVFITTGIWKAVHLEAWDDFQIQKIHIDHYGIDDNPLPVHVHVTIENKHDQRAHIYIIDKESGTKLTSEKLNLKPGINTYVLQTFIQDPELWWPTGLGAQKIYEFEVEVATAAYVDKKNVRFGIRQIELIKEADEYGESFYFMVNGLSVFIKGANYVPQDNFLSRVDSSRYEKLIASVIDANINMLRVWGGGFYENEIFYDLCDKNGILVWQDFMFACAMYPGDKAFLNNVRHEAIDNVTRLSNHPCIALWCGNNEIDEGWHNWGWQEQLGYSYEDSSRIWNDYLKLFHELLPGVVEDFDPGTIYHPSSPMTGWGRDEAYTRGDVHYWGVWWGEEPFDMYREKVGRFVSEYGFQGMPPMETIESFGGLDTTVTGNRKPQTDILEAHQKHPRGTKLIQQYMERDFIIPEKFEDYVYISQVLQAEGMGQAFFTHRISQPFCMGTLYWQLNDCWPVTSWSGIDYYGRRKALHYHVKRAFSPVLIRAFEDENGLHVFAVNEKTDMLKAKFRWQLTDFNGKIFKEHEENIELLPQSNERICLFEDMPTSVEDLVFIAEILSEDQVLSRTFYYFAPTKDMKLEDPGLHFDIEGTTDGIIINIYVEKLARQVFLEASGCDNFYEDNFFDMGPGTSRKVKYLGSEDIEVLKEKLKIKTIYDTY